MFGAISNQDKTALKRKKNAGNLVNPEDLQKLTYYKPE